MADEDLLLITPEERSARLRRRILLIAAAAVLLIALLAFFFGHSAAGAIRGWQAQRHAQKAFRLIDKEEWKDAQRAVPLNSVSPRLASPSSSEPPPWARSHALLKLISVR